MQRFNREKAIEVLLYVAKKAPIPDRLHVCKILYFADRYHLENHGRLICGDQYAAMPHGPVPSNSFDVIKAADRGEVQQLATDDVTVIPCCEPNKEYFSESDLEALDWAIDHYGNVPNTKLEELSHDEVWKAVTNDGRSLRDPSGPRSIPIPLEKIASTLPNPDALLEYLREYC